MSATTDGAARALDELAAAAKPSDLDKLDDSFLDRVARVHQEGKIDDDTADRLAVMWRMLKASDESVPWSSKSIIMAAITYFVSPVDLLPDFIGKKGYADDSLVVRVAYQRLGDATSDFR